MSGKKKTDLPFTLPPGGTVTFLFTDIEGSTRLLQKLRERYSDLLEEQRAILQSAFTKNHGHIVDTRGEEFFVAFDRASDAVGAAIAAQRKLASHPWPEDANIRVRMGIHTGEPWVEGQAYVGMDVHRAARIANLGHGGQILLSETTTALVFDELPEGTRLKDLGHHRMKDIRRPEQIHQLVIEGLPETFPPLKSLESDPLKARKDNLPVELTPFIGRDAEILTTQEMLLDPTTRLLTLLGVGGMGKTRLALHVSANLVDAFPEGVWLVELATLRDPSLVAQHTAAVFGVSAHEAEMGRGVKDVLIDNLRDRSLLMLLDNCEHLIVACASLAESLLKECPHLKLLATSREPLGIAGEHTFLVPAMQVPESEATKDDLEAYDATLFFLDRAQAAFPLFHYSTEAVRSIAEICRRLDGIPLAIELAAARVKILSPRQIADMLENRFRLLTGGPRTALERHQALQATLEWSYNLLDDTEQSLFRRLSVFAGGWTYEAADTIFSDDFSHESECLELLSNLVDKSLVTVSHQTERTRYGMLETVHQYAAELLKNSGELEAYRRKHADCFISIAEEADPELRSANQMKWLGALYDERENLRAALQWLISTNQADDAARLVGALGWFWFMRGYWVESWHWLTSLLDMTSEPEPHFRAKAICRAGGLQIIQGNLAGPPDFVREAFETFSKLEDKQGMAWCLNLLGQLQTFEKGNIEEGKRDLSKSIELFTSLGDDWGIAWSTRYLGQLAELDGDIDRAITLQEQALSIFEEIGDQWNTAHSRFLIGGTYRDIGEYAKAEQAYQVSFALCESIDDQVMGSHALQGMGMIAVETGRFKEADEHLYTALEIFERIGDENCEYRTKGYLSRSALEQGDTGSASSLLQDSIRGYKKLNRSDQVAICLARFAKLAELSGDLPKAATLIGAALNSDISSTDAFPPLFLQEFTIQRDSIADILGEQAFHQAYQLGSSMKIDQAISYALSQEG
jgi:predicted ATPase/class 3 adenylate cyclase